MRGRPLPFEAPIAFRRVEAAAPSPIHPAGERAFHRGLGIALAVAPVVLLATGAWTRRWMSDDGFIDLRVVSQLLAGHGPVFNVGERVEAFTSPLWVALLAAGNLAAPIQLEWLAVLLGLGLAVGGLALAIQGSRVLLATDARGTLVLPAGALVVAALPSTWKYSSSGLEGGLAFFWLGGALLVLARAAPDGRCLRKWELVVLGLGPLVRPEFAIFSGLFLILMLAGTHSWRARLRTIVVVLAVPFAYEVFRVAYYGVLVPNTAIAKSAGAARWADGGEYLRRVTRPYWIWLPVAVLAAASWLPALRALRRDGRVWGVYVASAFWVGGLLNALYLIRVGGDFMGARLLLPPLFAVAAPVAVVPMRRPYLWSLLLVPWAAAATIALRAPDDAPIAFLGERPNQVTVEDFGWAPGQPRRAWFSGEGLYFFPNRLDATPVAGGHDPAIASYGIGIVSYALGPDVYIFDLLGLADPFTAHLELPRPGIVGHEKPLPAPWIVARLAAPGSAVDERDFPFPHGFGVREIDDPRGRPFAERVASARTALACEPLPRFQRSYTAPLTVSQIVDNVRGAVANTELRIPPEPADAVARFCDHEPARSGP